jgi:hypothetical protein
MSAYNLSPLFNGWQGFSASGIPLSGGKLFVYIAGTTTPTPTYTTSAGSVPNANPIILGSDGRPPNEIWISTVLSYKFILQDSLGNNIAGPFDNIQGFISVLNGVNGGAF